MIVLTDKVLEQAQKQQHALSPITITLNETQVRPNVGRRPSPSCTGRTSDAASCADGQAAKVSTQCARSTLLDVMKIETITLEQWRQQAPEQRAKTAKLMAALGPIRRDKPRDPVEAELLRSIGTPERLSGPST
jgi:hypothetical protein